MITSDKVIALLKPEMSAHNTWGVGGDDVMLVIKFPVEWEVKHSSRYMGETNTVYVDMDADEAIAYAIKIIIAATDAKRIQEEYIASQEESAAQYARSTTNNESEPFS